MGKPTEVHREVERLFRARYPQLVAILTPVQGAEAARDAVQEAFIQAYRHWPKVRTYENIDAWLLRVATNRLFNAGRSKRRKPVVPLDPSRDVPERSGADRFGQVDDRLHVDAMLAGLTPKQRACVTLVYLGDLSIDAAAIVLDVSPNTVKATLDQSRKKLAAASSVSGPGSTPPTQKEGS